MSLSLSLATFFIIWWVLLFAVLPFGLRTQEEDGAVVPGTPEGAPANVRLGRIFLINTVVSAVAFAAVWVVVSYELVSLDLFQYGAPPALPPPGR